MKFRCQHCDKPLTGHAVGGLFANCLPRLALTPPGAPTAMGEDTRATSAGIAQAIGMELPEKTLFTAHGRMTGTRQYMSPELAGINALDVVKKF